MASIKHSEPFRVVARRDGTDLRTGSIELVVGDRVAAPADAPLRLARSPIEIVTLASFDEPTPHAPLRVFEVDAIDCEWDHDSAMNGYPYLLGSDVVVLRELSLIEALGFDPVARARTLEQRLASTTHGDIPVLLARFYDGCEANELAFDAAALRDLPIRFEPDGPWIDRELANVLASEASMARDDATNLARCDATGAVMHCLAAIDAYAEPFAVELSSSFAAQLDPSRIVEASLVWQLVAPLLAAPPRPLVNPFAPLAAIVQSGWLLLGWTATACVIARR